MSCRTVIRGLILGMIAMATCSKGPDPVAWHLISSPEITFDSTGPAAAVELRSYESVRPDSIEWLPEPEILEVSGLWKVGEETLLSCIEFDRAPWLDGVSNPVTLALWDTDTSLKLFSHQGNPRNRMLTWDAARIPPGVHRWTLSIPVKPHTHPRQVRHMEIMFQHLVEHDPGVREVMVEGETRRAFLLTPGTVISYPLPVQSSMELTFGISGIPVYDKNGSVTLELVDDITIDTLVTVSSHGERWYDRTIVIPKSHPGAGIRFRCSGVPVLLGSPVLHRPSQNQASRPDRPNIVLISLDTVRSDGLTPDLMPRLAAFTERCVSFTRAISQAPVTETAHHSIFTGLYVSKHGAFGKRRISEDIPTASTVLSRIGYRTAAFTDGVLVSAALGFAYGFERYWEYLGRLRDKDHLPGNLELAMNWIAGVHNTAPWFLFLHTYQAHAPYVDRSKRPHRVVEIKPNREHESYDNFISLFGARQVPDDESLITLARSAYESELRILDTRIGSFLDSLEIGSYLDQTMVVILSDHGEGFAEHGLVGHNNSLYQELLHIPLYIRFPEDRWGGTVVTTLVQTVDILPTILDHAGVEHPEDLDGRSLLPLCAGADPVNTPAFSEFHSSYSVAHWPYKLVVSRERGGIRLFDLSEDPGEQINIFPTCDEETIRSLRSSFLSCLSTTTNGMLLTISRPEDPSPVLDLYIEKGEQVEILYDGLGDWSRKKRYILNFHPDGSKRGDLVVVVKNADKITMGIEGKQQILPEGVSHMGPYEIGVRRCTGPRHAKTATRIPLGKDLKARLALLGYTE